MRREPSDSSPFHETSETRGIGRDLPLPPQSRRQDLVEVLHDVEVRDPYRWLEDQDSPETRSWIARQNEYTDSILGALPGRKRIASRMRELLHADRYGLPIVRKNALFYSHRGALDDIARICMRDASGKETILVDPREVQATDPANVEILDVSFDGRFLAYGLRLAGRDEISVHFLDTTSGEAIPDSLPKTRYFSVTFAPDGSTCFYAKHTSAGPRLYRHDIGTPASGDLLLFGETCMPGLIMYCRSSPPSRDLLVTVLHGSAAEQTQLFLLTMDPPHRIHTVVTDRPHRIFAEIADPWLFIWTNEGAERGRVLRTDLESLKCDEGWLKAVWQEIVPHQEDAVIQSMSAVGGCLWITYMKDVSSILRVFSPDGESLHCSGDDEIATSSAVSGTWNDSRAFFSKSSYHLPPRIYQVDSSSCSKPTLWERVDVPVDPSRYEVSRHWFCSKDGTRVPAFIFHRKGIERCGSNPTLLTGYGGFNSPQLPSFSATAMTWVDCGGVFVVACVRGGGEFGKSWHVEGTRRNKQNVFDDFIAAAEYLISERFASPQTLAISGGSNGGLLVAAAMTQRPELFAAVICSYPLLDMIRYHKFSVAKFWVPELGCADDKDEFDVLRSYSPYHRVRSDTSYPACLLISGDGDTRVAPLHARKMTAMLQSVASPDAPVLLRYHTNAGHAGHVPVSESIRNQTDGLRFLLWRLSAP